MRIFILLAATCCIRAASAQQISNAGLENWQFTANAEMPDSFWTSDQGFPLGAVLRTTDAHSGQYAARLRVVGNSVVPSYAGSLSYGVPPAGGQPMGWPFTGYPSALKFWYKYNSTTDTAFAFIKFTQWSGGMTNFVGMANVQLHFTPGYQQEQVPIMWFSSAAPDSVELLFLPAMSSVSGTLGDELYIDDIELEYTVGVPQLQARQAVIYPNPARSSFGIEGPAAAYSLKVYNTKGQIVYRGDKLCGKRFIDCSSWAPGSYLVELDEGGNRSLGQVIVRDAGR